LCYLLFKVLNFNENGYMHIITDEKERQCIHNINLLFKVLNFNENGYTHMITDEKERQCIHNITMRQVYIIIGAAQKT